MSNSPTAKLAEPKNGLDRYFKISERGSTVGREVRGGLVTFFAMCYIIVLNPLILGTLPSDSGTWIGGGTDGPNLAGVAATTALVAGVLTILMGVVANFPMAIAAGLGLNAVVTFGIAVLPGMTFADAMGIVVLEGIIILILVLTGFREAVFKAVPVELKVAISVGIGLFIALVGFVNGGFVTSGGGTPLALGIDNALQTWPVLVFVVGLALMVILSARKVRGAILISIISATVLAVILQKIHNLSTVGNPVNPDPKGWQLNAPSLEGSPVAVPDFSLLGQFNLFDSWSKIGVVTVLLLVFSLLLADFFDTMGTMVAVGAEAKLLDEEGNPAESHKILVVDSLGAIAGGLGGVSSNTAYIESTTGAAEGARTGLASVVTGVMFLLATFLSPLVALVPNEAAAPALVFVGYLMMTQVTDIKWNDIQIALPAFLTIVVMPFTYSITAGIGMGFLAYVLIQIVLGKAKKVHPLMWVASVMFIIYFTLEPILQASQAG